MKTYPTLRRAVAATASLLVFALILTAVAFSNRTEDSQVARKDAGAPWPLFGGTVQRNMVNTFEKNMPDDWSVAAGDEKNIKWSVDLGSKAYGGPVIADGKIFIGTNNERVPPIDPKITGDKGVMLCFRESDGKLLWASIHDKLPAGRVNDWPTEGICSSPVVEGKRLYYVSNRCEVICAGTEGKPDPKSPTKVSPDVLWHYDMIKELNVFPHNLSTCSPLIVGDLLFVVTSNGVDEGHINIPQPKAPSFICLNKKDGKLKWQSNLPSVKLVEAQQSGKAVDIRELVNKGEVLMHGQWSNPVYAEANGKAQVIFPGGNGWLYSFVPDTGELIWQFNCNPKDSFYVLGPAATRNDFVATPIVYDNKVYIGVGQDPEHKEGVGHLWCIDITKKGDVSPVNDNFDPKADVNKNSALVWHFGGFKPQSKEGKEKRNYYFGRTLSTCAVHDGLLYVGELAGILHCLDAKTGQQYWEHDMTAATWSSPYCVDGKVYMGNEKGFLLIFAEGKAKKLIREIDMETKVAATPVAANGVLYVMTENKLYAIEKK
jgi:outer membrane protein assembly factor BamB